MLPTFSAYRGRDWGINKLSKLQGMCSRSRSQTQSPQPHTSLFSLLHVTSGNACCVKCEGDPANIHQIPADHVSVRVETTVGSSGPGGAYAQVENRGQLWVSSSVTFHPIFWNKVYYFDLLSQQGWLASEPRGRLSVPQGWEYSLFMRTPGTNSGPLACPASTLLSEETYLATTLTISSETPTNQEITKTKNEEVKPRGMTHLRCLSLGTRTKCLTKKQLKEKWVYFSSQLKDSLHPGREGVAAEM